MFYILKENKLADIRGARKDSTVLAFVREVKEIGEKGGNNLGLGRRGGGSYKEDKPPVHTFTERRGKVLCQN